MRYSPICLADLERRVPLHGVRVASRFLLFVEAVQHSESLETSGASSLPCSNVRMTCGVGGQCQRCSIVQKHNCCRLKSGEDLLRSCTEQGTESNKCSLRTGTGGTEGRSQVDAESMVKPGRAAMANSRQCGPEIRKRSLSRLFRTAVVLHKGSLFHQALYALRCATFAVVVPWRPFRKASQLDCVSLSKEATALSTLTGSSVAPIFLSGRCHSQHVLPCGSRAHV